MFVAIRVPEEQVEGRHSRPYLPQVPGAGEGRKAQTAFPVGLMVTKGSHTIPGAREYLHRMSWSLSTIPLSKMVAS